MCHGVAGFSDELARFDGILALACQSIDPIRFLSRGERTFASRCVHVVPWRRSLMTDIPVYTMCLALDGPSAISFARNRYVISSRPDARNPSQLLSQGKS